MDKNKPEKLWMLVDIDHEILNYRGKNITTGGDDDRNATVGFVILGMLDTLKPSNFPEAQTTMRIQEKIYDTVKSYILLDREEQRLMKVLLDGPSLKKNVLSPPVMSWVNEERLIKQMLSEVGDEPVLKAKTSK